LLHPVLHLWPLPRHVGGGAELLRPGLGLLRRCCLAGLLVLQLGKRLCQQLLMVGRPLCWRILFVHRLPWRLLTAFLGVLHGLERRWLRARHMLVCGAPRGVRVHLRLALVARGLVRQRLLVWPLAVLVHRCAHWR
jgi:hypothetical protein